MSVKTNQERLNALTLEKISKFHHGGLTANSTMFMFDTHPFQSENNFVNHSEEIFTALAETWFPVVRKYVVNNPHTPQSALQYIVDRATTTEFRSLTKNEVASIVKHPNVTLGMIEQLWTIKSNHNAVASNLTTTTPVSVFERFFEGASVSVLAGFAENPATPTFLLNQLDYNNTQFRSKLAGNPNVTPETLTKIWAKSKTPDIALLLLTNPTVPTKTFVTVWNSYFKTRGKAGSINIITAILSTNHIHPLIVSKAKLFNQSLSGSLKNSAIMVFPEDYVNVLKPYYPEVTVDMPQEWLTSLLETVEENIYLTTVKELTAHE